MTEVKNVNYNAVILNEKTLRLRAYDATKNEAVLDGVLKEDAGCGYVLVPYVRLNGDGEEEVIGNVTRELADRLVWRDFEIFLKAIKGTQEQVGVKLHTIESVLFGYDEPNLLAEGLGVVKPSFMVLTTNDGFLGAVALFLPNMQERLAEVVGGNYWVLPSSVHEVLIVPDRGEGAEQLAAMVRDINASEVPENEQFGNRVLYYDREKGSLTVAYDMDKEEGK